MKVLISTVTYNRLELTKQYWEGIKNTTTSDEVEIVFIDNASIDGTQDWLHTLDDPRIKSVIYNQENVGVAAAVNQGWRLGQPEQYRIKLDNDVVMGATGWATRMVDLLKATPAIGQLGLRSIGVLNSEPLTSIVVNGREELLEYIEVVLGACTMVTPVAIEKIGGLYQAQELGCRYGYEDGLYSVRLSTVGLKNAYMRNVNMAHIDPGGGDYYKWKGDQAKAWSKLYATLVNEYRSGTRNCYYPL